MNIFADKDNLRQALTIGAILLIFAIIWQLSLIQATADYKQAMLQHDYALAGKLSQNGIEDSVIVTSFTSEKGNRDIDVGQSLLNAGGYNNSTPNDLLPDIAHFYRKYTLTSLTLWVLFSAILLGVVYYFTRQREIKLETATAEIRHFLGGDTDIRLRDEEEGGLSHLFAAVNTMATSLTSHIEKEKQRREFLKDTISDISHQLKTPLAALQMYNEIIEEAINQKEITRSFTLKSQRELERMETLIQNLLKLAKLDAGTIELEKHNHNMSTFMRKCVDSFHTRSQLEGKELSLSCNDSIELCFDEIWLTEAVSNIIRNALDHTHGGDRIEVSCQQNPMATQIIIKDSGIGIHPEDIHHIFKRFYRSRFSKNKQGIGIGLALSKAIIEKHGGTITVESKLQQGAVFYLTFPKLSNL